MERDTSDRLRERERERDSSPGSSAPQLRTMVSCILSLTCLWVVVLWSLTFAAPAPKAPCEHDRNKLGEQLEVTATLLDSNITDIQDSDVMCVLRRARLCELHLSADLKTFAEAYEDCLLETPDRPASNCSCLSPPTDAFSGLKQTEGLLFSLRRHIEEFKPTPSPNLANPEA